MIPWIQSIGKLLRGPTSSFVILQNHVSLWDDRSADSRDSSFSVAVDCGITDGLVEPADHSYLVISRNTDSFPAIPQRHVLG